MRHFSSWEALVTFLDVSMQLSGHSVHGTPKVVFLPSGVTVLDAVSNTIHQVILTTSDIVYFSVFSIAGTSCRWGDQAHHGKNPSWKPDQKSQMAFRNPITKQAPGYHEWSLSCNENPQFCKPWQLPKKKEIVDIFSSTLFINTFLFIFFLSWFRNGKW